MFAGLGYSFKAPGPGFIHRTAGITRKDGLIFDFIDMFRPVLRHYLTCAIAKKKMFTFKDFQYHLDEFKRRVYYLTKSGREKLRNLYQMVMMWIKVVWANGTCKSIIMAMQDCARTLHESILAAVREDTRTLTVRKLIGNLRFVPFNYALKKEELEKIENEFRLLEEIYFNSTDGQNNCL